MPDQDTPNDPRNLPEKATQRDSSESTESEEQFERAEAVLRELVREHVREALSVAEAEGSGAVIQTLQMSVMRQAPLPTPQEMAGYKEVDPDLPARITGMAERALEVRSEDQRAFRRTESRRPLYAFCAVLAVVVGGTLIGVFGEPRAGAWVIGTTVVGLAAVFLGEKWIEKRANPPDENGAGEQ